MSSIVGKRCDICNKLYAVEGPTIGHQMDVINVSVKSYDEECRSAAIVEYKDICPHCSSNLGMILRNLLAQRVRSELEVTDDGE